MPNDSAPLAERLNAKLHALFIGLVLAWLVANSFRPLAENVDLGWHVAQGRWMVQHVSFYHEDLFNYPNLHHAVIDEYPAFQIVYYLSTLLGWVGPSLLCAAGYTYIILALVRASRAFGLASSTLFAISLGLMALYFQVAFPFRPHLVTYVCVIALGLFLLRHRETASWTVFWPMALLQIAWTNSHSAFVLGPVIAGLFGAEMCVRHWIAQKTFPRQKAKTWLGVFLLLFLACFVNPYGWQRFTLPFYQESLESIRAYVGEMEPLEPVFAAAYFKLTCVALVVVVFAIVRHHGAMAFSFLIPALLLYVQTESIKKAWPTFGLFVPLLILSSGAFSAGRPPRWTSAWGGLAVHSFLSVIAALTLCLLVGSDYPGSLKARWRQFDSGRSELSLDATAWLKQHNLTGRLFHRCEDGGYLQASGFDQGETFADTGFGKYDEAFIHEVGLVNERPALVPLYLAAYQPDFVICSTFCYQWPYYLRQHGWRLVFYSPNSSVWIRPGLHPDLPTVTDEEVRHAFDADLVAHGMPRDVALFGRNLIALQSMGLEDFALEKLHGLPKNLHEQGWYWEAARFICFSDPPASAAHRAELLREAGQLAPFTAEFRAYVAQANGDTATALKILESIPPQNLSNYTGELLLKIYLEQNRPEALPLARRDIFDLRNGRHWQYLAIAEERAGNIDAAMEAWRKAVFYYPDQPDLIEQATAFAARHPNVPLTKALEASLRVYRPQ